LVLPDANHYYLIVGGHAAATPRTESLMANIARANLPTLKKTASYYVMHIGVALGVAYAVTGSLAMSVTLSLIEPTVQAVAFFFHEKAWERIGRAHAPGMERVPS
jgi:uncharacterized membrane protein